MTPQFTKSKHLLLPISLGLALTIFGGCHTSASAAQQQTNPNDPNYDPASANMAPVTGDVSQAATQPYPADQQPQQTQPAAPIVRQSPSTQNESQQRAQDMQQTGAPDPSQQDQSQQQAYDPNQQGYDPNNADLSDNENAALDELSADQPPPPLPQYDQPPAPEPNYMWTPGYWGYAPAGYYWVPGVWVAAPWPGALWTPGYWGFYGGHYRFHHGYWGRYIGFYGGVPYGFGYTGYGFYGGYWRGNSFYYNRAVTHINNVHITNVYNRTVVVNNVTRVSYNGGPRGIQVQPRPAEIAARREPRLAPMQSQMAVRNQAMENRQQFYSANRGRPAMAVAARPIAADAGVQRPMARPMPAQGQNRPGNPNQNLRPAPMQQPGQIQGGLVTRPGNPQIQQPRPTQPGQPPVQSARPTPNVQPAQPQSRPAPQQVQPQVRPGNPGENNIRPAPQQQPRPVPQPQYRPTPEQQPRPVPQQQPRPMPQQQYRPAPQQQPHPMPSPQGGGAPHGGGGGGAPHGGGGGNNHH